MTTLIATDLDQTLIYSARAIERWGGGDSTVAVERYRDADASFMAAPAAQLLAALAREAVLVPVTTRTIEQLARVRLPGPSARYAIAANGGVLLVDGVVDTGWTRAVAHRVAESASLTAVHAHALASCRPEWTKLVRTAGELFVYAVLDRQRLPADFVEQFVADQTRWAAGRGWRVSLQGRKLYWVPRGLTKSAAVAEVARRAGAATTLAAGDSLLDADLLDHADAGIAARHGELVASGWQAPHVAVTGSAGIRAGAEIVDWFAGYVRSAPVIAVPRR